MGTADRVDGRALAAGQEIERVEIEFAVRHLEPGMAAIDAGANIGLYTVAMARAVGPSGRVLAIEPVQGTAARLRRSIELNRLANVQIYAVALSDGEGEVEFYVAEDSAYSGIAPDPRSIPRTVIAAEARTLDSVWREAGCPEVRFLKLDVEGSELMAVRGAHELLESCRPLILVESPGAESLRPLRDALSQLGFGLDTPLGFSYYNHVFRPLDRR